MPKIKISENVEKITTPHYKTLYRLFDNDSGKAIADVMTTFDEEIDDSKPYVIFHPIYTWKKRTVTNFTAKKLLVKLFEKGKCVYESPSIEEIKAHCQEQLGTLWSEITRFNNPQTYYVDLSEKLWEIKTKLLEESKF